jgi:type IV secretory pathway VirB4 component
LSLLDELKSPAKPNNNQTYQQGLQSVLDLIAPADFIVTPNYLQLNQYYVKTMFVYTYPRYLYTNWLSPVITYDVTMDLSMFIYPVESKKAMEDLRSRIGQMESAYRIEQEKGLVSDPELQTAMQDVESLRFSLQKGEMKLFKYAMYFTIFAKDQEELDTVTQQLETHLGGKLIYTKPAFLQMEEGFLSTIPLGIDSMMITQNLDTGSISSTFPFTSTELTSNDGVLYGINRHNNSLVLFDRFSLENANMVCFGKSGGGKSYAVKLEALRALMWGVDIIVIDPEDEYRKLAEAVGGSYVEISVKSKQRINPFDLPPIQENETGEDVLREAVVNAHGLINLMCSGLTPAEDALLDKAIFEAYALKDITVDPSTHKNPPPLLTDLYNVLKNMRGAENAVYRLSKYTEGAYSGLFTQTTNVNLGTGFIDFSIKNLEDELRPVGMYLILNFIWQRIKSQMRQRILIVDEAWWMMQYEDSAKFLAGLCRRARKYYLGVSIISQDVEDFLSNKYGKVIVTNSSLQLLLKQSPASIDKIAEVFNLTEGEKFLILEADVGEGLFFAGLNHVAIKVIASYTEDQIITSDPRQILAMRGKATQ